MRKLLGVLLGLALVLTAIGFFRNWFNVTKTEEGTDTNINLKIDRQRIKEDVDRVREKASELGDDEPEEGQDESNPDDKVSPTEFY